VCESEIKEVVGGCDFGLAGLHGKAWLQASYLLCQ
jgi:hypothetical protein